MTTSNRATLPHAASQHIYGAPTRGNVTLEGGVTACASCVAALTRYAFVSFHAAFF